MALGAVEFDSIARGIEATDRMVKAARVRLVAMRSLCPGKVWSAVVGDTAEVGTAVSAAAEAGRGAVVEAIVIPEVHPDVYPAMLGATRVERRDAVGVVETTNPTAAILAADAAAKAAEVTLVEIRLSTGLCGRGYVSLAGEEEAVKAALSAGAGVARRRGALLAIAFIPKPDESVIAKMA